MSWRLKLPQPKGRSWRWSSNKLWSSSLQCQKRWC